MFDGGRRCDVYGRTRISEGETMRTTSAAICERCPKIRKGKDRIVDVSVHFNGQMLCPTHALESMDEAGVTLDESFGIFDD